MDTPRAKQSRFPLIAFIIGVTVLNLAFPFRSFVGPLWFLLPGFILGQMLFSLILGGLLGRFWIKGIVLGSLLASLWMVSILLSQFRRGWPVPLNEFDLFFWFFFNIPAILFGGSIPLLVCRYLYGWRLSRDAEDCSEGRNFGIQELFCLTAAIASFLILCRVPQIALEFPIASLLTPVTTLMGCLTALCLLVVIPLLYVSYRIHDRPRRWLGYVGLLGFHWLLINGLLMTFFRTPGSVLMATSAVLATALILFIGLKSLRMSGYVLTQNAKRREPASAENDNQAASLQNRKYSLRWAIGLVAFSALVSGSLVFIDSARTRIDLANLELHHKMKEQGSSIDLLGRSVIEINFGPDTTDKTLEDFQGTPDVQTISLANTKVTDAGLRFLSKFPRLNRLNLSHTDISDSGLIELQRLRPIWELNLGDTKVTLPRLVNAKSLTDASLDLSGLHITDEELLLLWKGHFSCQGRRVSLRDNKLTDAGLSDFFKKHGGEFHSLDLSGNPIDGSCLSELRTVRSLILEGLPLTDTSLAAVASPTRAFAGPTDKIGLAGNQLTAVGLNGLWNEIELGEGNLTDSDLRKCTIVFLHRLKLKGKTFDGSCFDTWQPIVFMLDLEGTGVTDETAKWLRNVKGVFRMNLANTEITDAALPFLTNAQYINLSNTRITFEGLRDSRLQNLLGIQVAVGQFSLDQIRLLKKKFRLVVGKM